MKVTWKNNSSTKKRSLASISKYPDLPFDQEHQLDSVIKTNNGDEESTSNNLPIFYSQSDTQLAHSFQAQGDKLAEDGKYREALGKWEAALNLMPNNAVLHEQKAQVLLEIGDAWNALRAATRATELEPSWAEAWITLGRAQLNYGEPDSAIESFDRVLAMKADCEEAKEDRQSAMQLVKRRKQLQTSGLITSSESRFVVSDKAHTS